VRIPCTKIAIPLLNIKEPWSTKPARKRAKFAESLGTLQDLPFGVGALTLLTFALPGIQGNVESEGCQPVKPGGLMKKNVLVFLALAVATSSAIGQDSLSVHLRPLAPFLGKTWRGEFKQSTPQKPMFDVAKWERALNGQAIRIMHSVNDGSYGGETIVVWDSKEQSLVFTYFTTAGFYTNGTVRVEDCTLITHEYVTGNTEGITEVKSTSVILPDGSMRTRSSYFRNSAWEDGHEILYREDPSAEVVFR
jgi:hypothetical protein